MPLYSQQDREMLQWGHGLDLGRFGQNHLGGPGLRLVALQSDLSGGVVGVKRPVLHFSFHP